MAKSLYLLLADDDLDDCYIFEKALKELPVETNLKTVFDGAELLSELSRVENQLPDLILLDLNMPGMTGIECLDFIKSNERLKEIPVVIFSTSIHEDLAKMLMYKGASKCIFKPSSFNELKIIILNTLSDLT